MKKLLVIIVGLFSLLMVYLSVKEVNIIQGTNLYLAGYTIADYYNEKNYSLSISGNNFKTIYNALIEFAGNEEITYVYSYEKNDDQLMYTILNRYIFSSRNDVMEAFDINIKDEIDFSCLDTDAYYSSAVDDQSSGRIMILDNHFFDQYLQIFNFKTFNKIEECKDNDLYINIVCKEEVFNKFIEFLYGYDESISVSNHTGNINEITILNESEGIIAQGKKLLQFNVIVFAVIIISMILKQNRNYMIRRMMGTSTIKIFINEFGKLFALLFGEFALINVLSFFILVKQESVTKWKVLGDIIKFDGYFLIILLGIGIISCLFIRLVGHVKYLNSHNQLSKLYYIQAIIKVIITVVLLVPFVNAYNYGKPYLINYLNVRAMKDEVGNLYSIDSNPEKSKEIFYEYIDKAVYCDFQTYFNSVDTLRYDDVSKDDVYPYPMIRTNAVYLKDHDIRDLDGNKIDIEKIKEDTILVPEEFKNGDLAKYQKRNEPVIYIKNNGKFYNYKLWQPYALDNPILYIQRTFSIVDNEIQSMFFKTDDPKVLKEELKPYNITLVSAQYRYDHYIMTFKEQLIDFGLIFIIYVILYLILIIQSILMFYNEHGKMIAVKYMLGKSKIKRYWELFSVSVLSYAVIFAASTKLDITRKDSIKFICTFAILELVIELLYISYYERKKMISLLKGEK
ncbi:DUF1430 domain-containing protein [Thomasclavelia spiroformis]|uniref:DUF1430 domain-containing protein n=1 Tax=Thomasclavelia spiroformis TaxID=29348 RepID=UPI00242BEF1C|nr:DUF1430 domain-containing protein [Thomasclavelia spiroformis]